MSDAADRLARSRQAIIEQVRRPERRHERRDEGDGRGRWWQRGEPEGAPPRDEHEDEGGGWLGHLTHALGTWWRHHPAHMGLEVATPFLSDFARRKPVQFLGIAAAVGAVVVVVRPWRLISATGLLMALLRSSQLSALVMSAMSAADFGKDHRPRN